MCCVKDAVKSTLQGMHSHRGTMDAAACRICVYDRRSCRQFLSARRPLVGPMLARWRRRIGSTGLFAVLLVCGMHGMSTNSAYAEHCLAAPTSTSPAGSHWFYRVDSQSGARCWYLRSFGQAEQRTSARHRPTAASHVAASHVQLIRRSSSSILGAGSAEEEDSIGRDDVAPSPDVASSATSIAPHSKAIAGGPPPDTFARAAPASASSPSIEVLRVRNANEPQLGEPATEPRAPVRVVWPVVPTSETAAPASESSADAKTQTALLLPAEADSIASEVDPVPKVDTEKTARPAERTTGSRPIARLAVFLFLLVGLPAAGILAWIVIRADNARGEQFLASPLRANRAEDRRSMNQRRTRRPDNQREADWLDDFLADLAEQQPTAVGRKPGRTSAGPAQPRADVADVVLRNILLAFRRKAATGYGSGSYAPAQGRMAAH